MHRFRMADVQALKSFLKEQHVPSLGRREWLRVGSDAA